MIMFCIYLRFANFEHRFESGSFVGGGDSGEGGGGGGRGSGEGGRGGSRDVGRGGRSGTDWRRRGGTFARHRKGICPIEETHIYIRINKNEITRQKANNTTLFGWLGVL